MSEEIKKYQQESKKNFRNAIAPKRYKNKRLQNIADDVFEALEANDDSRSLIAKLVQRNSEKRVRRAAEWSKQQPGRNKIKLFVQKLKQLRTEGY